MSKIICDVCGTSYPETSDQCPICGCVRPADVQAVVADGDAEGGKSGYTYVKGGRFSKANVKKRAQENRVAPQDIADDNEQEEAKGKSGSVGLIVTAVVLLLAIVAVVIYITVRFFGLGPDLPEQTQPSTTVSTTEAVIACTKLTVPEQTVQLSEVGSAWLLNPTKEPADTTDEITFSSSDETVATVSEKGKITAVSSGHAIITVTCGTQSVECRVICDIPESTEETTEATTDATGEETTEATTEYEQDDLRLNRSDITFSYEGETWSIYSGNIPVEDITWSSGNSAVATISKGVVTAVGNGKTTVYGKYGEMEVSCIIRCNFSTKETGIGGSDFITEDG